MTLSTRFGGQQFAVGADIAGVALADFIVYKNGSLYLARNTATNADDYASTNAASVVQSCHDALVSGGVIELKSGISYLATSQVILSTGGVIVRSHPQVGEDQSTLWQVTSSLNPGNSAFRITGSGCGLGGISIDGNSNADYGVDLRSGGGFYYESNVKNCRVANLYVDGPNGAQRCLIWNIRSDNPATGTLYTVTGVASVSGSVYRFATSATHDLAAGHLVNLQGFVSSNSVFQNPSPVVGIITNVSDTTHFDVDLGASTTFTTSTGTAQRASTNLKFDGPDHLAWGLRTTGTSTAGFSFWADTSRLMVASGHITGTNDETCCFYVSGSENRFSDMYIDTGPDGDNGQAHLWIQGSGNSISALVQNAATQASEAVTAVAVQSGTVYRFTTSTSHNYKVGQSIWLEGFASSNGAFQNTANLNVLVTNVSDNTHFDADLGAATTFTDQVGTAKKICKYGVLLQKLNSTAYVQGNVLHINHQGKGANANTGEFYYAVGFLDENGSDVANLTRFSANRIVANAAHATRFSNIEGSWSGLSNVDKIFVDAWQYQQDTTTPMTWRTKAQALASPGGGALSSWTINHGLAGTPTYVEFTVKMATDPSARTWVSAVNATSFTISSSAAITNPTFYWKAEM